MSNFQQMLSQALVSGQLWTDEPMSRHTTFRVGGPADYYVEAQTAAELSQGLGLCRRQEGPC